MIRVLWLLCGLLLLMQSCDRGPSIGEAEIATELRALRMAMRSQGADSEQPERDVQRALDPLRGVLQQMVQSQQQLNERQGALAGEMRRWTQLIAASATQERAETAGDLAKRLEQLEQQIADQEKRHQETEALLGDALARTADQLEEFLRRVGVDPQPQPQPQREPESTPAGGESAPANTPAPGPTGSEPNGAEPGSSGTPPPTESGGGGSDGDAGEQASLRWLWWSLAATSMITGLLLLHRRADDKPVGLAREMQVATDPYSDVVEDRPHYETQLQPDDPSGAVAASVSTAAEPSAGEDEPEIEELWTAAALLGEAIGKLKQTGADAMASLPPVEVPRPDVVDGDWVPDIPQADAEKVKAALAGLAELTSGPTDALPSSSPHDDPAEPELPASEPEVASAPDVLEVAHSQTADAQVADAQTAADQDLYVVDGLEEPAPHPGSPHISLPEPPNAVTFRLPLQDDPDAAQSVRELLASDPRVLVVPRPDVRVGAHELTVRFALLPGLPAAERSCVEQRLRDAIA